MTKEEKKQIIKFCKDHVNKYGSTRIGWCYEQIMHERAEPHIYRQLSSIINDSVRYSRERSIEFENDWDIVRDKGYRMQIFVALVSAILSAFISALVVHYITEYFDKEKDAKIKDRKAAKGTKSENRLSKKIDFTSLFF